MMRTFSGREEKPPLSADRRADHRARVRLTAEWKNPDGGRGYDSYMKTMGLSFRPLSAVLLIIASTVIPTSILVGTAVGAPKKKGEQIQPDQIHSRMRERPVSPPGIFSSLGIYNESPESPDGTRIAYIQFEKIPVLETSPVAPFSIWICNRNLSGHRMLLKAPMPANTHNGAFLQWVDNDHIAFCGGHIHKLPDGKLTDRRMYVINAHTGASVHGPFTGGFIGDSTAQGRVLMNIDWEPSNVGPRGIYELDTATGKVRCIYLISQLAHYADNLNAPGLNSNRARWRVTHARFSPNGMRLSFMIQPGGGVNMLFTCNRDGSDLIYWGTDKPMHELWFDEDTLCGCDSVVDDGQPNNKHFKRWDRNKRFLETLAGPVCHTAFSPDRNWFAGESYYRSDPVSLFLYQRGKTKPAAVVFTAPAGNTWTEINHVNPSFSRDGRRLYYNRLVDGRVKQVYCVELDELKSPPD
jgi:hypothetical protein